MPIQISLSNAIGALQGLAGGGPGPGPGPGYTPPLDDYPNAAAAYSVRLLRTAYSGLAVRVRRDVPPYDEQDIGFTAGGDLDEAAIVAFGGSDILRVSAWYDQSGNSINATQSIAGNQPQIYNGTQVFTVNGKAAIDFDGSSDRLDAGNNGDTTGDLSIFATARIDSNSQIWGAVIAKTTSATNPNRWSAGLIKSTYIPASGTNHITTAAVNYRQQLATFILLANTSMTVYSDGSQEDTVSVSGTVGNNSFHLLVGAYGSQSGTGTVFQYHNGPIQEVIYYNSNESSNKTGIESNINDYYEVFVNDEAATSGFLFDYPNAAVAYSVRQLNNNAEYAMQVERSDGRTKNIGFDGNGDLDTQAIIDFAGSSVATISQWYDQSGAQNHAYQITPGAQPQIYDGAAVITANGKPALQKVDRPPELVFTTSLALSDFCVSWAGDRDSVRDEGIMLSNTAGTEFLWDRSTLRFQYHWDSTTTTTGATGIGPKLYVINKNGSSINNRINGTAYPATLAGTLNVDVLIPNGVNSWEGEINEIIIWDSSKAGDQTAIETNINTYYSIY